MAHILADADLCSMRRFDTKALYQALDEKRKARELSWRQVATEIGVSVSTLTRTQSGGRLEVDGMLAMVNWLGVSVETFVLKCRTSSLSARRKFY